MDYQARLTQRKLKLSRNKEQFVKDYYAGIDRECDELARQCTGRNRNKQTVINNNKKSDFITALEEK